MKCSYALFIWVCFLITVSLSTQVQSFITTKEKVLVTISNRTTTATTKSGNANKKTVQHASPLDQFAPAAAVLFGNMITPASILGGAIIPISFASGLNFNGDKNESKFSTCTFTFFQIHYDLLAFKKITLIKKLSINGTQKKSSTENVSIRICDISCFVYYIRIVGNNDSQPE